MPLGTEQIERRFSLNKVPPGVKHQELQLTLKSVAEYLDALLPDGRAKSIAFTELQNMSHWAHAALAEED